MGKADAVAIVALEVELRYRWMPSLPEGIRRNVH
jgi:hypothetical protein